MNANIIAQTADLHIRFGSRHDEHSKVFARFKEDLLKIKPRRIAIVGDVFHVKINISPKSLRLAGRLFVELSEIAPVDVFIGNHDLNLQSLEQGDALSPIIELLENGFILGSKEFGKRIPLPQKGKGIYLYKDSGFYEVDDEITYGVFSCLDNGMPLLERKEKGRKYIAVFHGPLYGCVGDNGFEMKGDELIRLSSFANFDIVMMGDIHEYQSFKRENGNTAAYSGSLLQNNYGESIDKGYIVWDLSDFSHKRRFIPNDYGFAKISIAKGEIWEDRVNDIKFSLNKKKTKVWIELEDDEENYSVEKMRQIERYVKDKFGCENVNVDFKALVKKTSVESAEPNVDEDHHNEESYEQLLRSYLSQNGYDNVDDVIELAKETDKKLGYRSFLPGMRWELCRFEVYNLFMFPAETVVFDFDKLAGVTGIFGNNYSGKSNIIRALVWTLYQKILDEGESHKLVNMYTGVSHAWGKVYITMGGVKYMIHRSVKIRLKRDGTPEVSYDVSYQYEKHQQNDDGSWETKWVDVESENAAEEKGERKRMIISTIGTFDDFTKVSLQSQSGKDGYLSLEQQPKNDLINKFLGLEIYRDRYEEANETFKKIKAIQKAMGNPVEIETAIEENRKKIDEEKSLLGNLNDEKNKNGHKIDKLNNEKVELAKRLIKLENLTETSLEVLKNKIARENTEMEREKKELVLLETWLSKNFKKEIPARAEGLNMPTLESAIKSLRTRFSLEKKEYVSLESWIRSNPKKEEKDTTEIKKEIEEINVTLAKLNDKLKLARGEKCPTCGHVKRERNPEVERYCLDEIEKYKKMLCEKNAFIQEQIDVVTHNNKFDKESNRLESIKLSLQNLHSSIEKLKEDIELCAKKDEITKHNSEVESKSRTISELKSSIESRLKSINLYNEQITLIERNMSAIESNAEIEKKIAKIDEDIKVYKIVNLQLDSKIRDASGNIRVYENNISNLSDKLRTIRDADRTYKKYSVFLQAVGRDGIPAKIIRTKLPIINHRINSVLKGMVNFKIEIYIKPNGDIKESFFYSDAKTDALPFSMASGAQKFLGSLAIRDALHSVSRLTKPSLCIIDEGFGSLDNEKTSDVHLIFSYLKNKYKNVLIITHRNEIKDFVDNSIHVTKTRDGINERVFSENQEAGVSHFCF